MGYILIDSSMLEGEMEMEIEIQLKEMESVKEK